MSIDAQDTESGQLASRVAATLAAAEIPPSKLGPARRARLSEAERELYSKSCYRATFKKSLAEFQTISC